MKKILTSAQMREADEYTINTLGVPSKELMLRAGEALCNAVKNLLQTEESVLCVCGGGNNGGDGIVCACKLKEAGIAVDVVRVGERVSEDNAFYAQNYQTMGGEIYTDFLQKRYALIVDCLLGTGARAGLSPAIRAAVEQINGYKKAGAKVLSADLPTGLSATGACLEACVQADYTLCIGEYKEGALLQDGLDYAGTLSRADIGIALPQEESAYAVWVDSEYAKENYTPRKRNTHKGDYGKVAIVGGCMRYTGAPYLATLGSLRAGAGYTTLFLPQELIKYYLLKAPEALLAPISEGENFVFHQKKMSALLGYDAVCYGMGMGVSADVCEGAKYLIENYAGTLVLDADALNSLAAFEKGRIKELFACKKGEILLTPHIKEFSRLSGESCLQIKEQGLQAAKKFAAEHGVCVLLKSAASILTDGKRLAVITEGTAGQAKGGSGDLLCGVIAALSAGGRDAFTAAALGAYATGKAAVLAACEWGEESLLASDTARYLGRAFASLKD